MRTCAADKAISETAELMADEQVDSRPAAHRLPPELIAEILNYTEDWELAQTLNSAHSLPTSTPWLEQATPLDWAILSGQVKHIQACLDKGQNEFTDWGTRVMIRFGYIHLLEALRTAQPDRLRARCHVLLPELASAWGRTIVLEWAKEHQVGMQDITPGTMDEASRHGHVETLKWWKDSTLPVRYSEHALLSATIKRQIAVLEWWRRSDLPLLIGNVLDLASMEGSTVVLDWWAKSGLECKYSKSALYHLSCRGNIDLLNWWRSSRFRLIYDKDVLVGATKHGQTDALQWWHESGLPIQFRFFDIEEALEDAVAGPEGRAASLAWWTRRGFDSASSDPRAWMSTRLLSSCT
ncbi:uncharacterized protein L969DRAFT_54643 [Mixia osmundae IAM 14324]|uniref:Uncharacterized protein n=1 Tax=Mixia osmundae (strain CBS 9802 / IAM 14324 / JCM 22182 / KY 12970) TaxID=764103 RepID=G7E1K6_MIXOS|nr:uncharacterized protein L969DRAFT_54643 [Mixia osmundae IAM 14324]KEI36668.1 hypothetical protein L969DRAFT_54643 [Mixia osmundae IAM 14324]GAA96716.1 hypothetical protein E5Q_03387 [Mixia osmundae IAM 14324]